MSRLCGIFGRPWIDLSNLIDTSRLAEIDEEIVCALPLVEPSYTGGSLKWMGVTAPWVNEDPYVDYMHVIERFSREEPDQVRLLRRRARRASTPTSRVGPSATRPITRSAASRCSI